MDRFKFLGNTRSPSLLKTPMDVEPMSNEEVNASLIETIRTLYRNEVQTTVQKSGSFFGAGPYDGMASQFGSFDRLLECIEHTKCTIVNIDRPEVVKDEFILRVQVRVPVSRENEISVFGKELFPDSKGEALVSFYIGVCKIFLLVMKKNDIAEKAMAEYEAAKNSIDPEAVAVKPFVPEQVIPELMQFLRLDTRYRYLVSEDKVVDSQYFQSPEGFYYRIEVDGYSALGPEIRFHGASFPPKE